MNEPEKLLCIGGPFAGERTEICPVGYSVWRLEDGIDVQYYKDDLNDEEILPRLMYGYEQHCKAVAERKKPVDFGTQADKWATIMRFIEDHSSKKRELIQNAEEELKKIRDHYTASFLRSCKTVIIPSPVRDVSPLTLTYGKSYLGYLNDAMEFIVPEVDLTSGSKEVREKNLGRIETPIAIIP